VSLDLRVTGRKGPVWLVLGQSLSKGWHATAGGKDLGAPVLVDGYANGWLVDPGTAGEVDVRLRWTPQRIVWAGIAASLLGGLLCVAILVLGLRRKRWDDAAPAPAPSARVRPFEVGAPVAWPRAMALAAVMGLLIGLVVHPLLGLAGVAVTAAALRVRRARAVGALGVLLLAGAGIFTAVVRWTKDLKADFGWTDFFHPAHFLAWSALALIAILLLVDRERPRE
jgi:hypothetical protein